MGYALNAEPDLQSKISKAVAISDGSSQFPKADEIFPYRSDVSQLINFEEWVKGLQFQKPLYLVLRRGTESLVLNFLK